MNNNLKRILKSRNNLEIATNKKLIATITRLWVEWDPKIHALNYWYYRYFTNEFELYCLRTVFEDNTNIWEGEK